ncbi:hypothetical protein [Andreprevotia chitinilytica]|uniref:hypothetical protein n=1 Tax=Andreprevotia chitinilytica TaxID=396808 RepID=UPI000555244E|nr:hypothetical protein [Andreprevotia chitinilytica]
MGLDEKLYQEIAQVLVNVAPEDAEQIFVRAELSAEDDHCKFEFDYSDQAGNIKWFTGGGKANSQLLELLVQLRKFWISQGQSKWKGCEIKFDVNKSKIQMNFKFD